MNIAMISTPFDRRGYQDTWSLFTYASELAGAAGQTEIWVFEQEQSYHEKIPVNQLIKIAVNQEQLLFPEQLAGFIAEMVKERRIDLVLFSDARIPADLALWSGRTAGGTCLTDINDIKIVDGDVIVTKQMYSGNLTAEIELESYPVFLTVKAKTDMIRSEGSADQEVTIAFTANALVKGLQSCSLEEKIGGSDLSDAIGIVAGGRGINNAAGIELLNQLAARLAAKVGVSRPAALNGWAELNQIIGLSGQTVSPEFSLLFGISGSAAFLEGIERGVIIAINKDPYAPVLKQADYGVLEDWKVFVQTLIQVIDEQKEG